MVEIPEGAILTVDGEVVTRPNKDAPPGFERRTVNVGVGTHDVQIDIPGGPVLFEEMVVEDDRGYSLQWLVREDDAGVYLAARKRR